MHHSVCRYVYLGHLSNKTNHFVQWLEKCLLVSKNAYRYRLFFNTLKKWHLTDKLGIYYNNLFQQNFMTKNQQLQIFKKWENCCIQQFFGSAVFLTSIARRKTVVQLGSLGQHCKTSPVGSRGETPEIFGYFAFWIAQNIALLALKQGTLAKAYTRNQHFWVFGGLNLGSETGIPASK